MRPAFAYRYRALLGIALISAVLGSALQVFGLTATWQERLYDRFFLTRTAPQTIVIVGIDDESENALGGWPLPRQALAIALEHLGTPRAVGLDIVLADPSARGAADDAALASAFRRSSAPITLAAEFDERGGKLTEPI